MNVVYDNFLSNMLEKLTEKVDTFLETKNSEINTWGTQENISWDGEINKLMLVVEKSIQSDAQRQMNRDKKHQIAQSWRDFNLTSDIEQIEKEITINQIQDAKRLCNLEKKIDSRMLQVLINYIFIILLIN